MCAPVYNRTLNQEFRFLFSALFFFFFFSIKLANPYAQRNWFLKPYATVEEIVVKNNTENDGRDTREIS